jgi:hypothetical protein
MKRILLPVFSVLISFTLSFSQSQLENPGFEEWEEVLTGIFEPGEWSSLKTSDNSSLSSMAPVVCEKSTDAHSGSFSVKLTNVSSLVVANGTVTNGRVHPNLITSLAYMYTDTLNSQWNTPFTYRPDSITGWFKYAPKTGDSLEVKAILHRGFGKQPDDNYLNNWIAVAHFKSNLKTGNQWVRFSAPFIYYSENTPQYILVILNSGNGYNPVAGSIAYFDDIEMIYNNPLTMKKQSVSSYDYIYSLGNQYIVIQSQQPDQYKILKINDITGRVVWSCKVTSDHIDISQSNLKKGIYLVSLSGNNLILTQKILIR